jgi:S1-C subfamily serine protease
MFTAMTLQAMLISVPVPKVREPIDLGPGFFGVWCQQSGDDGLVITDLIPDSPATRAGIQVNDLIISFNGKKLLDSQVFSREIYRIRPTTIIPVVVRREGKEKTFKIIVGVRPETLPPPTWLTETPDNMDDTRRRP